MTETKQLDPLEALVALGAALTVAGERMAQAMASLSKPPSRSTAVAHRWPASARVTDALGREHGRVRSVSGEDIVVEWSDGRRAVVPESALLRRYTSQSKEYGRSF